MSNPKPIFIPHPLTLSKETAEKLFDKQEFMTLEKYMQECANPIWAASHLIRAVANGLTVCDLEISKQLSQIADKLATKKG